MKKPEPNNNHFIQALKKKGLRVTDIRIRLLALFENNKKAFTHADIEKFLSDSFDRVTIYRTLSSFFENGLLHKVPDESGILKYALCHHEHHEENEKHSDNHVHFICKSCDNTICFDHLVIPDVELPKGFQHIETSYLISGICHKCSSSETP